MSDEGDQLRQITTNLGIGDYRRHVLLCTGPKCCTPEEGLAAWEVLKQQLKDKGLTAGENACYRTKVGCLRICVQGPTMVVYPEGTWYHGMSAEKIPEFVQKHLVEGKPLEELIFARNALSLDDGGGESVSAMELKMTELLPDPERAKSVLGPNNFGDQILVIDETNSRELTPEEKAEYQRDLDRRYLEKFGHPRPPKPPMSEAK